MGKQNEKEEYRKMIIEMVRKIENLEDLRMIYGMTSAVYRNIEKAEEG